MALLTSRGFFFCFLFGSSLHGLIILKLKFFVVVIRYE